MRFPHHQFFEAMVSKMRLSNEERAEAYQISRQLSDEQFAMEVATVAAAADGQVETLRQLLEDGASPDSSTGSITALEYAINNEHVDCVRLLLEHGADVERADQSMSPLRAAVDTACDGTSQRNLPPDQAPHTVIDLLLAAGADPRTGLETAKFYRHNQFIEKLEAAIRERGA